MKLCNLYKELNCCKYNHSFHSKTLNIRLFVFLLLLYFRNKYLLIRNVALAGLPSLILHGFYCGEWTDFLRLLLCLILYLKENYNFFLNTTIKYFIKLLFLPIMTFLGSVWSSLFSLHDGNILPIVLT